MSTDTFDQRFLRAAQGVAVPAHTETDRSVLAHPIPDRGGNSHVHDHHLYTAEDHIPVRDVAANDLESRPWWFLLYGSLAVIAILFVVMIARG